MNKVIKGVKQAPKLTKKEMLKLNQGLALKLSFAEQKNQQLETFYLKFINRHNLLSVFEEENYDKLKELGLDKWRKAVKELLKDT